MRDKKVLKLDNRHSGTRGFVIGGGPSIKDYPPDLIEKLSKEITVGANHAWLLFTPTYLCFIDKGYYRDFHKDINALKCIVLYPDKIAHVSSPNLWPFLTGDPKRDRSAPKSFFARIPFQTNAGVTALRIAYILGCNPIYLIGIDLNKEDKAKGITHFHDAYDQRRKSSTRVSRYDAFEESFVKTIADMENREIYSCSPKCEVLNDKVIPFRSLEEILNARPTQKEKK